MRGCAAGCGGQVGDHGAGVAVVRRAGVHRHALAAVVHQAHHRGALAQLARAVVREHRGAAGDDQAAWLCRCRQAQHRAGLQGERLRRQRKQGRSRARQGGARGERVYVAQRLLHRGCGHQRGVDAAFGQHRAVAHHGFFGQGLDAVERGATRHRGAEHLRVGRLVRHPRNGRSKHIHGQRLGQLAQRHVGAEAGDTGAFECVEGAAAQRDLGHPHVLLGAVWVAQADRLASGGEVAPARLVHLQQQRAGVMRVHDPRAVARAFDHIALHGLLRGLALVSPSWRLEQRDVYQRVCRG